MDNKNNFPSERRRQAVQLVLNQVNAYGSHWAGFQPIAPKFGCTAPTLRSSTKRAEAEQDGVSGFIGCKASAAPTIKNSGASVITFFHAQLLPWVSKSR